LAVQGKISDEMSIFQNFRPMG